MNYKSPILGIVIKLVAIKGIDIKKAFSLRFLSVIFLAFWLLPLLNSNAQSISDDQIVSLDQSLTVLATDEDLDPQTVLTKQDQFQSLQSFRADQPTASFIWVRLPLSQINRTDTDYWVLSSIFPMIGVNIYHLNGLQPISNHSVPTYNSMATSLFYEIGPIGPEVTDVLLRYTGISTPERVANFQLYTNEAFYQKRIAEFVVVGTAVVILVVTMFLAITKLTGRCLDLGRLLFASALTCALYISFNTGLVPRLLGVTEGDTVFRVAIFLLAIELTILSTMISKLLRLVSRGSSFTIILFDLLALAPLFSGLPILFIDQSSYGLLLSVFNFISLLVLIGILLCCLYLAAERPHDSKHFIAAGALITIGGFYRIIILLLGLRPDTIVFPYATFYSMALGALAFYLLFKKLEEADKDRTLRAGL